MLGFFTRLPVPKIEFTEERYRRAMKLMPLVGLVVGVVIVLISLLLSVLQVPGLIRGGVLVCAYIILTGGLHFDGLADTFDGVFSARSREQSLEIMKDSRIGVFGLLGIVMVALLYFATFIEAPLPALLLFPLCGRACCLISASLAPYAREDGMGKATSVEGGPASVTAAIVAIVGASFLTIPFDLYVLHNNNFALSLVCSLIAAAVAVLVTACVTAHFKKKLGGVTGDTFGAVIEISSIAYLLVFAIIYQVLPL